MKKTVLFFFFLLMISCNKKEIENESLSKESLIPPYDTVAIDSFSAGATSVDVARQIKISSMQYQDSLRKIQAKMEEEKLLNKQKEEKEKEEKKIEEEKKKAEETKKKTTETPTEDTTQ
jgi:hypothetical protein